MMVGKELMKPIEAGVEEFMTYTKESWREGLLLLMPLFLIGGCFCNEVILVPKVIANVGMCAASGYCRVVYTDGSDGIFYLPEIGMKVDVWEKNPQCE